MISIQHNPRSLAAIAASACAALLLLMHEPVSAQGVDASASVGGVDASASVGGGGGVSADVGGSVGGTDASASASIGAGGASASIGGGPGPAGVGTALADAISGLLGLDPGPAAAATSTAVTSPAFAPGVSLAEKRRRCLEILSNSGAYDEALVALCAQVTAARPRSNRRTRQARN
jgi:hypothetical protein